PGLRHSKLIDFQSVDATRLSTASIFTLQTDELLKGARLDYGKTLKGAEEHLHNLKGIIESIPQHDAAPIHDASVKFEKKHHIAIPYPEPKPAKDAPYKISYEPPARCNVVGSYRSKTMVKTQGSFAVDMVVEMPRSIFQEKDYQNLRYFYRRAYYIAYVAAHVRDALGQSMEADFEFLNDNRLLPVLALHPKLEAGEDHDGTNGKKEKKASKKSDYTIRIIPCAPKDLFPPNKLMPTSNANKAAESDEKKATNTATPFYNSTLKAESTFMEYLKLLTAKGENSESKNYCPAFRDACMLGRIWLQQRGFSGAISGGGFGHFEWALTMALLLESGGRNGSPILSSSLCSTELFKATIQYLAERNFNKAPTILGKGNSDAARENGPVLFDGSKNLNILYKMTPSSASLLQMQAKSTMDLLADESADKFAPIFIVKANVFTQLYDAVFEINSPDLTKSLGSTDGHGAVWENTAEIYKVLKKAYGSRADLVHIHQPATRHWPLGASPRGETQRVLVGVSFDFPQMSRQMEHGPPAEEQK
ncbi:MAG: hypothetical protein CME32_27160, partial [Gimesia sp.]|nr:hypothetical protein [Gimesia sp.]